ncbi:hypothetical protein JCM10207_000723 [Rhodosporidiobolus poonsookiae]
MSSSRPKRAAAQRAFHPAPEPQYYSTGAYPTRRSSRGHSVADSVDDYAASGSRRSTRAHQPVHYDEEAGDDDHAYEDDDDAQGEADAGYPQQQQQQQMDYYDPHQGQYQQQQQQLQPPPPQPQAQPPSPFPSKIRFTFSGTGTPAAGSDNGAAFDPGALPPLPGAGLAAGGGDAQGRHDGEEDDAEGEVDGGDENGGGTVDPSALGGGAAAATGDDDAEGEDEEAVGGGGYGLRNGGRASRRRIVDSEDNSEDDYAPDALPARVTTTTSSGRTTRRPHHYGESDDEGAEEEKPRTSGRLRRGGAAGGYGGDYVEPDDEFDASDGAYGESRSRRSTRTGGGERRATRSSQRAGGGRSAAKKGRTTRTSRRASAADQSYEDHGDGSSHVTTDDEMLDLANDDEDDDDESSYGNDRGGAPTKRQLRNKPRVNYYTLPPLEAAKGKGKDKGKGKLRRPDEDGNPFAGLPANMTGAQWAALYPEGGQPSDSSDDDDLPNLGSPRKNPLFSGPGALAGAGGGGMLAGGGMDFGSGAPNNLGKVGSTAALADTDPLGVPSTISFDSVGGLGSHIQQLKEMVSLPLLYPEVFERFAITPPRGVLFHGPPGTGKTLLARALAASCSTEGRKISFFMRKGADCLSKWVGEAERQLRLLFEEAKNCQPSIIFFDEIDGLAPVRSSKQEQIHASIVSTLLALMDGMDGRGQVIVIGATNRPDAIDPALRRPGRFDREFYFPLPNVEARRKILDIHTNGWNPPLEEEFKDELAKLTKGYGGADLRALCTEAALNAVQRTYPQIYKTNDRLLIKPESIGVTARDFVLSQKNLIPSTARSTSSAAAPLPAQLVPLLTDSFENAKLALARVLPEVKRVSVLEEAEFVEQDGGGFEREKMLQSFETLRVFRPRLLICGDPAMGQSYVGAAVLHHLEGFHVQTLDLATLVSDSTRTMEAACVQLFIEAKRHKPSILFIPSLVTWCASVGETVRATIKGLLDGLDPSDPILLLAVVDGPFRDVPADVRSWFGFVKGNRVTMAKPGPDQRREFFADVLAGINRPPNEYPDALPRRKRILEKLPIAPPPPPRAPTAAEIAQQEQNDLRLLEYLKWKLGPVLAEMKKRYKRFQRSYYRDWQSDDLEWRQNQYANQQPVTGLGTQPYHNVDLDSMHSDLYKGYYRTPDDFLTDVLRIQHNAEVNKIMENDAEAPVRAGQMVNHVKVMVDQTFDAHFRTECEKMAGRMAEKEKDRPRMDKDKRKGKGGDVADGDGILAAAREAAKAGGLETDKYTPRVGAPPLGAAEGEAEVLVEGADGSLKRAREEGEAMEGVEGADHGFEDGQGPAKRFRPDDAAAVDLADGQAVASGSGGEAQVNGLYPDQPAFVNGTNGAAAPATSLNDLLNPTSNSSLLSYAATDAATVFSEPQAQPNPFAPAPVAPPMAVGAAPSVSPSHLAVSTDPIAPAAPAPAPVPAPGSISFLTDSLTAPAPGASNLFSPAANGVNAQPSGLAALVNGRASVSREVTPSPTGAAVTGAASAQGLQRAVSAEQEATAAEDKGKDKEATPAPPAGDAEAAPRTPSPEPMQAEPTPEPFPDFLVPSSAVDALSSFLIDRTGALNIDQLEQLRAALFDGVWRGRAEWDRAGMVHELDELAREFVEEVEALAEDLA